MFLKRAPNVSLPERKRKKTKVQEEYYWAITKAGGAVMLRPIRSSLNFKMDSHVYTYKAHHMCNELGLA